MRVPAKDEGSRNLGNRFFQLEVAQLRREVNAVKITLGTRMRHADPHSINLEIKGSRQVTQIFELVIREEFPIRLSGDPRKLPKRVSTATINAVPHCKIM